MAYGAPQHLDQVEAYYTATDGIRRVAASGIREVVLSPVGFVADHLGTWQTCAAG